MQGLTTLLPDFLKNVASDPEAALVFLDELWPRIVGRHVAGRSRPVALRSGRLTLEVADAAWRRELEEMAPWLRKAINRFWRTRLVNRIEFSVRS